MTSAKGDAKSFPQRGSVQACLFGRFFVFFFLRTLASFIRSLVASSTSSSLSPLPRLRFFAGVSVTSDFTPDFSFFTAIVD
jgi:hypothetical protein